MYSLSHNYVKIQNPDGFIPLLVVQIPRIIYGALASCPVKDIKKYASGYYEMRATIDLSFLPKLRVRPYLS